MRSIGIDIHRDFMEVAIAEGGQLRGCPRVAMDPETLQLFAECLGAEDQVALEVSGNAWEVVRIIRPHVGRVVAASPTDTGMRSARAKTDRLDARALAKLLASGQLETVWVPDEGTQAMRRRLRARSQLVVTKSRAKNEVHAALMRRLVPKPGFSDLFGVAGRRWLSELELPAAERESVDSALRQIAFCEAEIAAIEKLVATARKLACLFWTLLTRGEDYAYGQPSLRQRKLCQLELRAGAPRRSRGGAGVWKANAAVRDAERKAVEQAEAAYRRNVAEFKHVEALRAKQRREAEKAQAEQHEEGAGATSGRAS